MAIWSLTQERVEKLRKQIGDKEEEVDTLIKLSPKDIWNVDLDAFVNEWNTQIDEDAKRKKKIAGITRRASKKLGIEGGKGKKKKRKAGDSDSDEDSVSDFGPAKKKPKPKKEGLLSYLRQDEPAKKPNATAALKSSSAFGSTAPPRQGTLLTHLVKKESTPQVDGASDDQPDAVAAATAPAPALATKRSRPTAIKKAPIIESDDDDSDVFAAVAKEIERSKPAETTTSRTGRAATKQAPKYNIDNSDSDSDGDDLLGDVSTMVKTIGAAGSNGVPLFKASSAARPGSNGSARPASAAGAAKTAKKNSPIEIDDDTTNYEGLMPQPSPKRPVPRNVNDTIMSSDDDDDSSLAVRKPAPSKLTAKSKLAATKPASKPKATSTLVAKKSAALSPAAKAYAAKLAKTSGALSKPALKAKKPIAIDSDDDMEDADAIANDLLSDEEDDEPTPQPAKRAPAARPGRRAAAAKPAKYVVSDDEAESDEASEPSFDDDESE
jgi:DNA topoisomerase-2